jgi:hypothetical protein
MRLMQEGDVEMKLEPAAEYPAVQECLARINPAERAELFDQAIPSPTIRHWRDLNPTNVLLQSDKEFIARAGAADHPQIARYLEHFGLESIGVLPGFDERRPEQHS